MTAQDTPNAGPLDAAQALDPRALVALRDNQRQLDQDGVEVGVSRQALDETLAHLAALQQQLDEARAAAARLHGELEQRTEHWLDEVKARKAAELALSERDAPQAQAVKALEWADYRSHWTANCEVGQYQARRDPTEWAVLKDGNPFDFVPTVGMAFAAAQADFEQRILSALTRPSTTEAKPVEATGEAQIVGNEIRIAVSVSALKTAVEAAPGWPFEEYVVADPMVAAKSIVHRLNEEDEIGTTLLHRAFDKAAAIALEQGDEGFAALDNDKEQRNG